MGNPNGYFAEKYKAVPAYESGREFLLLAKFDLQGEACEVILTKYPGPTGSQYQATSFTNKVADALLDELSPPADRGARQSMAKSGLVDGGWLVF